MADADTKFVLDPTVFWNRVGEIYQSWAKGGAKLWGESTDSLVLVLGEEDDVTYSRTRAVSISLTGEELTQSVIVFTATTLYVLTGKIKAMEVLGAEKVIAGVPIKLKLILRKKEEADNDFATLIKAIKGSKKGKVIGVCPKDVAQGGFAKKFQGELKTAGFDQVDVSTAWSQILAIKDAAALSCIEKAAYFSGQVLKKYLLQEIEGIVDEEKLIAHSKLSEQTDDVIEHPDKVKSNLKPENLQSCYNTIIQSGGKYDLKPSAESNDENIHYGTIICSLGARYKFYCSNISRTYLFNPTQDQEEMYTFLMHIFTAVKLALRPEKKCSDVYMAAANVVKGHKNGVALLEKFTKNVGCGMGVEFREGTLVLSEKNTRVLKTGMVFNVAIGFENLESTDPEKKKNPKTAVYSLLVADTIRVTEDEAEVLTRVPRGWKEASYTIGEGGSEEEEEEKKEETKDNGRSRGISKANLREGLEEKNVDKGVKENQRKLAHKRNEEALKRLAEQSIGKGFSSGSVNAAIVSYRTPSDFPEKARKNQIHVDPAAESLLLPIEGQMVPFHIATVKNVHKKDENSYSMLSITFLCPGEPGAQKPVGIADPKKYFVKEMTFKSSIKSEHLNQQYLMIKELKKRYLNRLKENELKETLVLQEELRQIRVKTEKEIKLRDVSIRPILARKKVAGVLMVYDNGFRYVSSDKLKLDIVYKNIKQAFFQPAQNSVDVIIHLELHNAILLDKKKGKKTNYVQIFVEVVEAAQDLNSTAKFRDEDGLLEEQQERRARERQNQRFHAFVKEVEAFLVRSPDQPKIKFDVPFRELAFTGCPNRSNVEIMPTVHSLISLEDTPPMVITLEDIEIASFERVQFSLRNFDLAFVFKDWKRPVTRIDTIPAKSLEPIKQWLDKCNIVFYESPQNLLWKVIIKEISQDPENFYKSGGWDQAGFLKDNNSDGEEGDEGEADGDESESSFRPSSDEEESSDESDDDDGSEVSEDEDEEEWDENEGDEGDDWEEMEKKAARADVEASRKEKERAKRGDYDDSDDDKPKKKSSASKGPSKSTSSKPAPSRTSKPAPKPAPSKSAPAKTAPPARSGQAKPPTPASRPPAAVPRPGGVAPKPATSGARPPIAGSKPAVGGVKPNPLGFKPAPKPTAPSTTKPSNGAPPAKKPAIGSASASTKPPASKLAVSQPRP